MAKRLFGSPCWGGRTTSRNKPSLTRAGKSPAWSGNRQHVAPTASANQDVPRKLKVKIKDGVGQEPKENYTIKSRPQANNNKTT